MKTKILFISNTANFSKFNRPFMQWCRSQGWRVDYCAPDDEQVSDCDCHRVMRMSRSPFSLKNLRCIKELREILEVEQYDILHCHTPVGGVVARLAAKNLFRRKKIKIIYTAHGFHFFRGASLLFWIVFYPIEKYLSRYTNVLITINKEDYDIAQKKFYMQKVHKIDGVGVNLTRFFPVKSVLEKNQLRAEKGFHEDDFILIYTAEFIPRKNHKLLFSIIPMLLTAIPCLKIVLAGKGALFDFFKNEAVRLHLSTVVIFTGYTKEIDQYCRIADICISTSLQEGQGINLVEGLSTGLPVVCSKIRGHIDVISNNRNGILCPLENQQSFIDAIQRLYCDAELRSIMKLNNIHDAKKYSVEIATKKMAEIYTSVMN